MKLLEIIFWILVFIVFYAYIGYGMVLFVLIKIKRLISGKPQIPTPTDEELLPLTFIVAAYNEERWIEDKIINTLALDYPRDKVRFFFVTDGSSDSTPDLIRQFKAPEGATIKLFHEPERKGKIAAVHRVMQFVDTPVVVFTDANTDLNPMALRNMERHFHNPKIGAVAGEKRIQVAERDEASGAGEGIYWKYESLLKKWDSEIYSVVGAAGELFAIRTNVYEAVPHDTVCEDFYMTMRIAQKGYKVVYEPDAYAAEGKSASVAEELKRKIRIAAGGIQAIVRLLPILNIFKYGILSFEYISHRVLRWTLAPLALPLIFILNILLVNINGNFGLFYKILLFCQVFFYIMAIVGYLLERSHLKFKAFFVPFYFCMMNYAVYRGFIRYWQGNQSVLWEKSKRA